MPLCCKSTDDPSALNAKVELTLALAGNPNCGKTTIFNALTGLKQRVANYPGITVEKKTGRLKLPDGRHATLIDLPGTYSLVSRSPDETVAMEVLRGLRPDTPAPDAVIVVVDASNLQRNLYLVSQLIELGRPMVVVLNMMDIARRRGVDVSSELLEKELGVPVVPVVGHRREGIDELKKAIARACSAPMPKWPLPESFKAELDVIRSGLLAAGISNGGESTMTVLAERLLVGDNGPDVAKLATRPELAPLISSSQSRLAALGIDPMQTDIEAHYRWIEGIALRVESSVDELAAMGNPPAEGEEVIESPRRRHLSERLDSIFIHKIWGFVIFAAVMAMLFVSIFWLAKPIMDGITSGITWLGAVVTGKLSDGPIKDMLKDGVFAGVGAVVVFVPQIALLFLFLAILEDSGYLARAAFLMDRLLAKVGLHGKSFIPLLSSFACAIPGIMATRTIEDRKSRLATILIAPFMSCSARLPVYTLLIGTFFASAGAMGQAGIMLSLYLLGIVAAGVTAWFFKGTLLKGGASAFILELPTYKLPQVSQVVRHVLTNTWEFIARAGTVIFFLSIILWAMAYYPRLGDQRESQIKEQAYNAAVHRSEKEFAPTTQSPRWELTDDLKKELKEESEKVFASEQIRHSIAGRIGRTIEPVIAPLGYDWKIGVGLVGAFAAREIFVSTMGIIYSVGEIDNETVKLEDAMKVDKRPDGTLVWSTPVALSLLVWFVLAMQCMSTLAIVRRETGGWKWPLFMIAYMNSLAYVGALATYHVARWIA